MIFLCGLFIPVQVLPVFLRPISYSMPLTYGADILNAVISGRGHIGLLMSFLILIGFSIGSFVVSTRNVKRKWIY
jgi:ABC-2 type transport system permease protein